MDLYQSYPSVINKILANVNIIADIFYVIKQTNNQPDNQRKAENKNGKVEIKKIKIKVKNEKNKKLKIFSKVVNIPVLKIKFIC